VPHPSPWFLERPPFPFFTHPSEAEKTGGSVYLGHTNFPFFQPPRSSAPGYQITRLPQLCFGPFFNPQLSGPPLQDPFTPRRSHDQYVFLILMFLDWLFTALNLRVVSCKMPRSFKPFLYARSTPPFPFFLFGKITDSRPR